MKKILNKVIKSKKKLGVVVDNEWRFNSFSIIVLIKFSKSAVIE